MPALMQALTYNQSTNEVKLQTDYPVPHVDSSYGALVKVLRAGVCSTDLEICRGYVPGYNHILGHEFVGRVEACPSQPDLVGKRVVGEINCNVCRYSCADAIFQRNHAEGRTVLGIINKDGCMAEYLTLPVENLHLVPDSVSDQEACYAEPLAAACRVVEQGLVAPGSKVAVLGDGKLGLLVSQVLACHGGLQVTLFGRHSNKMGLVQGLQACEVADEATGEKFMGKFDVCVEATGSASGIKAAVAMVRPMGTLVLKSTVSILTQKGDLPTWSELANDIVVNEKILAGSRCGPFDVALQMLERHSELRNLVNGMTSHVFPLSQGLDAMQHAQQKGVLKVQLLCSAGSK